MIESIVDPLDPVLYGWSPVSETSREPKFEGPHVFRAYAWGDTQELHTAWDPTSGGLRGWCFPAQSIRPHVGDGELFERTYAVLIDRREPRLGEIGSAFRSHAEIAEEYQNLIWDASITARDATTPEALYAAALTYAALVEQWNHQYSMHVAARHDDARKKAEEWVTDVDEVVEEEHDVEALVGKGDRALLPALIAALGIALGSR